MPEPWKANKNGVNGALTIEKPEENALHGSRLADAYTQYEKHGFCANNRQWRPDAYGFAVPVSRPVDSNVFIFNCGVPASDDPFQTRLEEFVPS